MEDLFMLHNDNSTRANGAANSFFRSQTTGSMSVHGENCSEDVCSDCSECGPGPASRRIALAKRVLAKATHAFTPNLSITAAKTDKCKNSGALGPLLAMIQSESEPDSLRCSLDTLSFLLLDKANRKVFTELGGVNVLLNLFIHQKDTVLLRLALDCLCSMVKCDEAEKDRVWSHPGKEGILALINPRAGMSHLLEILCLIRKMAFKGSTHRMELLEPRIIMAAADVLSANQSPPVLLKCCKLLKWCADCAGHDHLQAWHQVLFCLVPLLRDPGVCEGALSVLLSLSDRMAFKNMFMAAGGVACLLPLLMHPSKSVATTTSCIVSCLSEGGLSRDQLCLEPCLAALLKALACQAQYTEVSVAIIYSVNNLVTYCPPVISRLQDQGAARLLSKLIPRYSDIELALGAAQLLDVLNNTPALSKAIPLAAQTCDYSTDPNSSGSDDPSSVLGSAVARAQSTPSPMLQMHARQHSGSSSDCASMYPSEGVSRTSSPAVSMPSMQANGNQAASLQADVCTLTSRVTLMGFGSSNCLSSAADVGA